MIYLQVVVVVVVVVVVDEPSVIVVVVVVVVVVVQPPLSAIDENLVETTTPLDDTEANESVLTNIAESKITLFIIR